MAEPFAHLGVVLATPQYDAPHPFAPLPARCSHDVVAIGGTPRPRSSQTSGCTPASCSASMASAIRRGRRVKSLSLSVAVEAFEPGLSAGDRQSEHEQAPALRPVQIIRETFQPRRLSPVEFSVSLRVVPHQHFAERGCESLDVLGEAVAMEIELILPRSFGDQRCNLPLAGDSAGQRGPGAFAAGSLSLTSPIRTRAFFCLLKMLHKEAAIPAGASEPVAT